MLNIELIRFEAQDVITASVAAPAEKACEADHTRVIRENKDVIEFDGGLVPSAVYCGLCGKKKDV